MKTTIKPLEPECRHSEFVFLNPVYYDDGASLEVRLTVDRGVLLVQHVQDAIRFLAQGISESWYVTSHKEPCGVSDAR